MLACLALRATTKTRCLADRRVAPIAIPECRNGSKAFDLLRAAFRHRGLSAVGKAAGHESRLRGPRKRPYGLHERKPQHWRSEAFGFRVPRDSPAPEASGCPTSAARSVATQSRKRPRWLSCRGHLTQTEGRADAVTAGEGRPSRAIPITPTEPPRDLQATSSTRRLKRRNRASDAPRFVVARQRMYKSLAAPRFAFWLLEPSIAILSTAL